MHRRKMIRRHPSDAKKQVVHQQSYLNDDLITQEILTRMPVESILRFKSVSKQWYSTLSSSNFANAHLMKSPFSNTSAPIHSLLIKHGDRYFLLSCDHDNITNNFEDNLVELDAEFNNECNYLSLTGCCNGLICLTSLWDNCFIVWNPATRKWHKYEFDGFLNRYETTLHPCVTVGFGYASSVQEYKYVRILTMIAAGEEGIIVHVFSLSDQTWRKIDFNLDIFAFRKDPVLLNEKLYWRAYKIHHDNLLLSFDLGLEKFDIFRSNLHDMDYFGAMGGYLCMSNCDRRETSDQVMHILKSTKTVESIRLPKGLGSLGLKTHMIGFTRTGKFFAKGPLIDREEWGYRSSMLSLVDINTEPTQYSMLMRFLGNVDIAGYVPSLVSPFPTIE